MTIHLLLSLQVVASITNSKVGFTCLSNTPPKTNKTTLKKSLDIEKSDKNISVE